MHVEDCMVVRDGHEWPEDKVLATCATIDESALLEAMKGLCAELQPDPCVHEVATWVGEHAFEHVRRTFG